MLIGSFLDLLEFFEHVPNILRDESSRFSFFNGLGATSTFGLLVSFALSTVALTRVRPLLTYASIANSTTDALFYDVYSTIAELHLKEMSLRTIWSDVDVHAKDGQAREEEETDYDGVNGNRNSTLR